MVNNQIAANDGQDANMPSDQTLVSSICQVADAVQAQIRPKWQNQVIFSLEGICHFQNWSVVYRRHF